MAAVKASALFSACVRLGDQAGRIIRNVWNSRSLNTFDKSYDNPCTAADLGSQKIISATLLRYFPGLQIIGEETIEINENDSVEIEPEPLELFSSSDRDLDIQRITIWIDPLDGTKNFVMGDLEGVTTLIGVAYDENPIFGVIHQPFGENCPSYFGGVDVGVWYKTSSNISQFIPSLSNDFSIASSRLHKSAQGNALLEFLHPDQVIYADGCGFKSILVLRGQASIYLVDSPFTSKWDICPSVAIMRSLNGYSVDLNGNSYRFDKETSKANSNGIIITLNQSHLNRIIEGWRNFDRSKL
ncbi:BPNT1_2 [Blepharisma stoltei]|uniref:3'(2'),5'-bisphosphate nucleotidase n=1 Tax=Blepharisma stoltei TaxID=1481888 RepID=A0AAU9JFA1_9CILI|nr:unnamed protein product [Blepharisma stoltei]